MCIRDRIQDAWAAAPPGSQAPHMGKHSVNAAIGLFERLDHPRTWSVHSSRCEEDISKMAGFAVAEKHDNGVCDDYFVERPHFTNMSFRPIREQILQDEHLRMALALEILQRCGVRNHQIKLAKTDAWFLRCKGWMAKKAQKALVSATFENLHKTSECCHWQPGLLEAGSGEGRVFRWIAGQVPTQHKESSLFNQKLCPRPHVLPDIQVFREGEGGVNVQELALKLTREERSFLLVGPPGTGKSFLLRQCLELLPKDDEGRPIVTCAARTHVASRQFDAGVTLSRLKHSIQKGRRPNGVFAWMNFL